MTDMDVTDTNVCEEFNLISINEDNNIEDNKYDIRYYDKYFSDNEENSDSEIDYKSKYDYLYGMAEDRIIEHESCINAHSIFRGELELIIPSEEKYKLKYKKFKPKYKNFMNSIEYAIKHKTNIIISVL
jgi:hypothetical protein